MSLLVWNCRGLANPRAIRFLKETVNQLRPSLIFLSEILVKRDKVDRVCKLLHFAGCFVIDAQGHGGGLALLWKNEGGVDIKESSNHFIDFEVSCEQIGRWRYTGFYGCPERGRRRESWDLIRNLASRSTRPWCIIGDFNDIMFAHEKSGGRSHSRVLLEGFAETVSECGLVDLGFVGNQFTWEKSRGTVNWVQERLDRGLANYEWKNLFPSAEVKVLDVSTSDHLPLFLQLNKMVYAPKKKRFRFENMWIQEGECFNLIKDSWNTEEAENIMEKINFCCLRLEEWGGGKVKKMRDKLKWYKCELRKYRSRQDEVGVRKYNEAREDFLKLLEKQEVFWKQRAKQFWLKEGDQNTRFFHNFASGRKRNNQVKGLMNKHDEWKETDEDVQGIIVDYFSNLFKASAEINGFTDRERVQRLTEEQNNNLGIPITSEEVRAAVFSMYPEKSPGGDGLNPAFFQTYWTIVGRDVIKFCQDFFETGELRGGVNRTLVCLIPKVREPKRMTDLRPISLCNVLMRILSKVMANRLKGCLSSLISEQQSAFVEGRLLTDNALIAFEMNHYIQRRRQGRNGVVGMKIDVSKAYDRLEWSFIEEMLNKFGFNQTWIHRVMTCVRTVTYSFLQNGTEFGDVQPERGIRQGDPISPYLYILCAEGLSSIIRRNEEVGLLHGCKIARGAPSISHLLFADDCYFFFRATVVEAMVMKSIIQRYENISGQAINFNKSSVLFSPNTDAASKVRICEILGVAEVAKPGKYLGVPMQVGKKKSEVFNFLKDRVSQKLQGWVNKPISKAGKVTLLKTAAQSIPNFWMNLMLIPADVCNGIQRLMNGYWRGSGNNGKGIKWMTWERMCMSKEGGGLGFRELKKFNLAMLAKQGWRLLNNDNSLVTTLMKARYFPNSDFLSATLGHNPSYMWRSILAAQEQVKQGCRRRIGNGDSTMVWKVPWLPSVDNGFLTSDMPLELQNITVQSLMVPGENRWDEEVIDDICNARDAEIIKRIPLSLNGRQDSWFWSLDNTGLFTVKSCYRRIQGEHSTPYSSFWKKLWSLKLPGKIVNFLWRACRACIPTAVALLTKRVQIDVKCPWCRVEDEDEIHVLFTCSFAKSVWETTSVHDLIQVLPGEKCFDALQRFFATGTTNQLVLIALICWNLWNRRNKWVWDKINMSVFGVREGAMNLLYDWRKAQLETRKSVSAVNTNLRKWSKPEQGWFKVNVDAARFEEGNSIGLGAVIRNDQGEFVRARSRRIGLLLHPREAEAISLREALSWVKDLGYKNCVFETDAKQLADACNGIHGESYFHTLVLDCVDFYKHFENVLVRFVHRSANVVAHKLARATSSMSDVHEWITTPPDFVFQNLVFDSI